MQQKIKVAGYIRVSTSKQVEDESLSTQRKSIEQFVQDHKGYELVEIYEDAGISGGTVAERKGLLKCLQDGLTGKFSLIVIHRLSRFGRNAAELLTNFKELKAAGIDLWSISENIDFSTSYGEAILGMLAVIAQLEKDIIKEQMLENRIARAKRGVPTSGKLPYGRTFDKAKGEWVLDEDKASLIRQAADEFLSGRSLAEIAEEIGMTYNNLLKILGKRCGDEWVVKFKDQEPIVHTIPRLLPDEIIERIQDRFAFNKKNNRMDLPGKYLLTGFIRCSKCKSRLSGVTINYPKTPMPCYRHKRGDCRAFTYLYAEPIEKAVFETIFENIFDVKGFEKAIAESLPDDKMRKDMEGKIRINEKRLHKTQDELKKLVDALLKGTLAEETISAKEKELLRNRTTIEKQLEADRLALKAMPDTEEIKHEAEQIRRRLLERYSGLERLHEMSFDEKRDLLHWLFDGKDPEGTPYGIYITTTGRASKQKIDYFLYGKITGLRTLKDGNINYQDDDTDYKTNKLAGGQARNNLRGPE